MLRCKAVKRGYVNAQGPAAGSRWSRRCYDVIDGEHRIEYSSKASKCNGVCNRIKRGPKAVEWTPFRTGHRRQCSSLSHSNHFGVRTSHINAWIGAC